MDEKMKTIRLLLVDDEEDFLLSSSRVLERRGFKVDIAPNGVSALEKIEQGAYDVVVLDVKMPDIDGIEVFNQIRATHAALPVILLTGHGSVEDAFETSKSGVADYLSKPIDMDALAEKIQKVAARSSGAPAPATEEITRSEAAPVVKVLLIDDEVEFLESMRKVLGRRNMDVLTAPSGDTALDLLAERTVDVAVLDLKMPGMSGQEVLRLMKQRFPAVEVIILTGHPSVESALEVIKLGANEYMKKPPSIEELVSTIRRLHESHQQAIQQRRQELVEEIRRRFPD